MRFLREYQDIKLDDGAVDALVLEMKDFLRTRLSLADWESLDANERKAAVIAAKQLELERASRLAAFLKAQSKDDLAVATADVDGGAGLARCVLERGVQAAAKSLGEIPFQEGP